MNHAFDAEETHLLKRVTNEVFWRYCAQAHDPETTREDLFHFGVVGLLEARQSFDPDKGTPWIPFASIRVRGEMMDYLRKAPLVRLPQEVHQRVRALRETRQHLVARGLDPCLEAMAGHLGWSLEEAAEVEALAPVVVGLDHPDDEDEGPSLADRLVSDQPSPEALTLRRNLAELVQGCLQQLTPLNRLVILGRMLEDLKLRELAVPMGCTEENVRVREKKSLSNLKECLEKSGERIENLVAAFD